MKQSVTRKTNALTLTRTDDEDFQYGENGTPEYTTKGTQDPRLALFFTLLEGCSDQKVEELMNECFAFTDGNTTTHLQMAHDMFVMAFQTLDCRGGKGEKELFYNMFVYLYKLFPETAIAVLPLIPEYGYYKDYFRIMDTVLPDQPRPSSNRTIAVFDYARSQRYGAKKWFRRPKVVLNDTQSANTLVDAIVTLVAAQLHKDNQIYNNYLKTKNISSGIIGFSRFPEKRDRLSVCEMGAP